MRDRAEDVKTDRGIKESNGAMRDLVSAARDRNDFALFNTPRRCKKPLKRVFFPTRRRGACCAASASLWVLPAMGYLPLATRLERPWPVSGQRGRGRLPTASDGASSARSDWSNRISRPPPPPPYVHVPAPLTVEPPSSPMVLQPVEAPSVEPSSVLLPPSVTADSPAPSRALGAPHSRRRG